MQFTQIILKVLRVSLLILPALSQPSWKTYPFDLEPGHPEAELSFPAAEANHLNDMSDTWFVTGTLQGKTTGRNYQFATIFDRNDITAVLLDFYQISLFELGSGTFGTYTDYDLPVIDLIDRRLHFSNDHLDLSFDSGAGKATWANTLNASGLPTPFVYDVYLPGIDSQSKNKFSVDLTIDMQKVPVPFGADSLRGIFTFYAQKGTHTYFQTGPKMNGTVTFLDGISEEVEGSKGHIDRQWFPLYSGILTPTGRQHSHEWRQINFDNGEDFSIWRQFDRVNNNTVIADTGSTYYNPSGSPIYAPNDLQVEYRSYAKYPRDRFTTLIPPPSVNMYMPSSHILTSQSLGMNLSVNYIQPVPAVTLPIEYFEGPATFVGTLHGQPANGTGIFESTFALYRDWELVDVLSNSVSHLPATSFAPSGPDASALRQTVEGVRKYVSANPLKDNKIAARVYLENKVRPALNTLAGAEDKAAMIQILNDLEASFALVLQF